MTISTGFVTNRAVDLMHSLDTAGQLGFDFVEILMHGTGHRDRLQNNITAIRECLDKNQLTCIVHLPHSGVDIGSSLEYVRVGSMTEIKESLRIAGTLGAQKAVLHPTSNSNKADERQQLMIEGVREINNIAIDHGVEICAENMHGKYATIHEVDEILENTDANLTFDTGHALIEGFSATDSAAFLEEHSDRVSHLHLNDTRGTVDEHLPVGAGTIDFGTILRPLQAAEWTGTVSLEVATENLEYIAHSKSYIDSII